MDVNSILNSLEKYFKKKTVIVSFLMFFALAGGVGKVVFTEKLWIQISSVVLISALGGAVIFIVGSWVQEWNEFRKVPKTLGKLNLKEIEFLGELKKRNTMSFVVDRDQFELRDLANKLVYFGIASRGWSVDGDAEFQILPEFWYHKKFK